MKYALSKALEEYRDCWRQRYAKACDFDLITTGRAIGKLNETLHRCAQDAAMDYVCDEWWT